MYIFRDMVQEQSSSVVPCLAYLPYVHFPAAVEFCQTLN